MCKVTNHAIKRYMERSTCRNKSIAVKEIKNMKATAKHVKPNKMFDEYSKMMYNGANYYRSGIYILVYKQRKVVTVYIDNGRSFI